MGTSPKSKMVQDVFFHFLQVRVAEMDKILPARTTHSETYRVYTNPYIEQILIL